MTNSTNPCCVLEDFLSHTLPPKENKIRILWKKYASFPTQKNTKSDEGAFTMPLQIPVPLLPPAGGQASMR